MNNIYKITLIVALLSAVVWGAITIKKDDKTALGNNAFQSTQFNFTSNNNAGLVNGVSTQILATTTTGSTRVYARFCNASSGTIYLNMDQDKPVSTITGIVLDGFPVFASTCYDITGVNLYQGAIQASSTIAGAAYSMIDVQL